MVATLGLAGSSLDSSRRKGVQQCRVRLCSLPDLSWPQAWGLRRRRGFATGTIEAACYPEVGYDSCLVDPLQRATPEGAGFAC